MPLSQIIFRVNSRCDLACDHCYVYEAADQSWRSRPRVMLDQVTFQAVERIAEHARPHGLDAVHVVLHGGEPSLAGRASLRRVATGLQSALRGFFPLHLTIHTSDVPLDEEFCGLSTELGIKASRSADGDRAANDRHSLDPPRIDFLLPHATWDEPPVRAAGVPAEYADWLITAYDRWMAAGRPVRIRTFDSLPSTPNGGHGHPEASGSGPVCRTCHACPVVASRGGGLYAHRYGAETGFDNPSVYCSDLMKLITCIIWTRSSERTIR